MRKFLLLTPVTLGLLCFFTILLPAKAVAEVINVTVIIEANGNDLKTIDAAARGVGLSNCKQLVETAFERMVIIQIACNELMDFDKAISDLTPPAGSYSRMTTVFGRGS